MVFRILYALHKEQMYLECLQPLGVKTVGIYGGFFRVPEGFSRTEAMDQALLFARMVRTGGGVLSFRLETAKTLRHLRELRDRIYSE